MQTSFFGSRGFITSWRRIGVVLTVVIHWISLSSKTATSSWIDLEEGFEDNYTVVWPWRTQTDWTDEGLEKERAEYNVCRSVHTNSLCISRNSERMNKLMRRRWLKDYKNREAQSNYDSPYIDISSNEFDVHRFLSSIAGKKVGFVGDSVMAQIYSAFVCFLTKHTTSKITYNYGWTYGVKFIRDDRCPATPKCDLVGGTAFFTESNTTFFTEKVSRHSQTR